MYDGVSLSAAVCSGAFCVAVAVIVALPAVISVPGAVDQVGFSYPSFAVTVGYLSAVNFVPIFTSYTLLFAMSFTPSPFLNVTLTYPSGVGASGLFVLSMISSKVAFAVNLKYPLLLYPGLSISIIRFSGVHVTGALYPSSNVTCGKSVSLNVTPGLTYVVPVVLTSFTPVEATNLTSILSLGKSSLLGEFGSLGSIVTMWSLTVNICFGTSMKDPSVNVTFNVPSDFPALLEFLPPLSVIVAASSSVFTSFELLSSAATTPLAQSMSSPFQTLIV